MTVANIPTEFRTDVFGEVIIATDNVLTEATTQRTKKIAFMFEFDGDIKAVRHCLYNCHGYKTIIDFSNKNRNSRTTTQELTMVAAPRPDDGVVNVQPQVKHLRHL